MTLLTVNHLTLTQGTASTLRDLSFTLAPGERVALLGASGSGKSLTAQILLGLTLPQATLSGSVRLAGEEISTLSLYQRRPDQRIAAIFQDPSAALHPLFSVGKQLDMALRHASTGTRNDRLQTCRHLLQSVGFSAPDSMLLRYPGELSGGQRQRLCIALALVCQSTVMIADEPTTALDVVTQTQVLDTLRRFANPENGRALLFITHDIAVAASLCQRAIVLSQGEIIEQGTMARLLHSPHHPYTRGLVAAARQQSVPLSLTMTPPLSRVS